jgi:oligosaccharide reducing-end xylanase
MHVVPPQLSALATCLSILGCFGCSSSSNLPTQGSWSGAGGASKTVDSGSSGGTSSAGGVPGSTTATSKATGAGGTPSSSNDGASGQSSSGPATGGQGPIGTGGKATGGSTAGGPSAGGKSATAAGGKAGAGGNGTAPTNPSTGGKSGAASGGSTNIGVSGSTGALSSPATETIPGNGCTPPSQYANLFIALSGKTQAETDAKITAAWSSLFNPSASGTIYHDGPGTDESYVEDTGNNDARTEGMSYGMMISVQLNHQTEFDRLWTFTKKHMVKSSGGAMSEITWNVQTNGSAKQSGGAPDGDEYYAAALVFAHNRWGDTSGKYDYKTEAQAVLDLVRTKDFNSSYNLVKFYAGGDNGQTDASYILPAFYQTWACFDTANAAFWNTAVTAARKYFQIAADKNGQYGDQGGYDGGSQANTGVDKIRCVMNIMMDHNFFNADPWQTDTYAKEYSTYESSQNRGGAASFCNALLGFGLPESSGKAFVDKLWSASAPSRDYWNGVLYMLALLQVSGTFHLYY